LAAHHLNGSWDNRDRVRDFSKYLLHQGHIQEELMAAKVKSTKEAAKWKPKASVKRPGVVSKKKNSSLKTSKNYRKPYRGQG
jgi:hypothetical protein